MSEQHVVATHPVPPSILEDPDLSSDIKKFLIAYNLISPPPESIGVDAARFGIRVFQAIPDLIVDLSGVTFSEQIINVDGFKINLHIVRPKATKDGAEHPGLLPAFMYFHGGGFVVEDFSTHRRLVRDLVVRSGAVAVFPDYSLSPKVRYPVAVNECYAATKWVAEHGKEIGVDGSKLAVIGNSAGGNLSAVISIIAKEKGTPKLKSQVLLWPWVDLTKFDYESCYRYGEKRTVLISTIKWMADEYTPNVEDRSDIHVSPIKATKEELHGLPPALILVAQSDPIRDQGEDYGRLLDNAGVDVTTVRFNGVTHDWALYEALRGTPQSKAAIEFAGAELHRHLFEK